MTVNLLRSKVVALTVGPAGLGAISLVDQVASLVGQICSLSLPFAAVKFLSAAHSESSNAFARLYIALLRVSLISSLTGIGIAIALLVWRPAVLGAELAGFSGIAILALLTVPGTNLTTLLTNAMAAARRVRASAIYGLVLAVLLAALSWTGVVIAELRGYYLANLVTSVVVVAGGILYLRSRENLPIHPSRLNLFHELRRYPKLLSFSAAIFLTTFTSPLADLVARYAILHSRGLETTGLFQAAIGISYTVRNVVRSSFSLFLTPALNRKADDQDKLRQAGEFLRVLAVVVTMLAMPLVLAPDWCLFLLYSRRFVAAAPVVYLFVVAMSLQQFAAANVALLIGLDDISGYVRTFVIGDLATAALSWWLAPHFGLRGVAVALLVNGFLIFALSTWWLWSHQRMAILRVMGWLPFVALATLGVAGAFANWLGNTPGVIPLKAGLWAILSLGLLRLGRVGGAGSSHPFWRFFRL